MKPLNIDKTGCSNISSNCVTWQGPDIECINLCKGDSVTEVVYKMALELCKLMDTFDLTNYDLKCFSSGVCQPQDFKDFINILINKVCLIQTCSGCADPCSPTPVVVTAQSVLGSSDSQYVPIAKEFQYTNSLDDLVTTMLVSDYVQAIGNKVSILVNSTTAMQEQLLDHTLRIQALEDAPAPVFTLPLITNSDGDQMSLSEATQNLQTAFYQLETATGTPNEIYTNIAKQSGSLNTAASLSVPNATMASLPGWNTTVVNQADSVGNIWQTVLDMRLALQNLITNYIPSECRSISISLIATYATDTITLFMTGVIPSSFTNTIPGGTPFTITDMYGNVLVVNINIPTVINNPEGFAISITGTRINPAGNLAITAEPSFTNNTSGSECKSILQYLISNQASCPAVTYVPARTSIEFSFLTDTGNKIYTAELWAPGAVAPTSSQSFTSTAVDTITSVFATLTANTAYRLRILININGIITTCPFTAVNTLI
jgi:hypothetical protein